MKRKLLFGVLFSLLLSSCTIGDSMIKTEVVEDKLYSFVKKTDEVIEFDDSNTTDITYQTIVGEPLNPYFSLEEYMNMYEPIKVEGYKFVVTKSGSNSILKINNSNHETVFAAQFNTFLKIIFANGNFSDALINAKDYSKSSLSLRMKIKSSIVENNNNILEMDYEQAGYRSFTKNGVSYFPLSLLETVIAPNGGVRHLFNYRRIVQFDDNAQLEKQKYKINDVETTFNKEMADYIDNTMQTMPLYLREDRLHSMQFLLENLYGLKQTKKINSMIDLISKQSFYKDFLSGDATTRREAYFKLFAFLDDGHTSIRDNNTYPWRKDVSVSPYGPKVTNIFSTYDNLRKARPHTPGQVYYSSDEKLAFVSFDSFTFAMEAYESDGTLKTSLSDYNSEYFDTFFYMVRMLNEIKEKGTAKDVVIDLSVNGGGTVALLFKLLALLSKDNSSLVFFSLPNVGITEKEELACDSNGDGKYLANDGFGNDFNFYLLTSNYTFSCANAFAYYANKNKLAKIIGMTSGGGECTVGENYLPSGEHFFHSSHMHIGWYEDNEFTGDEDGAPVDIEIEQNDFYNLDKLEQLIRA